MPFDITVDLDTPVSVYLKLRELEPAFLLESVEGGERQARYSFIGLGRSSEVVIDGGSMSVGGLDTRIEPGRVGMLRALRKAVTQAPELGPALDGVPLAGGLVGVTGFGLQHAFEDLPGEAPEPYKARYMVPSAVLVFDHRARKAGPPPRWRPPRRRVRARPAARPDP